MKPLKYCLNDPNFHGVYFRNTTGELISPGGLWPEGCDLYRPFNPKENQGTLKWTFPVRSSITCSYMEHEKDADNRRGLQFSFIGWDELDKFSESQFISLQACLRSKAKNKSFMIGTCNPNPDSWILKWIDWWIDDEGFPIEDRCGVVRYFVLKDGIPRFGSTEQEVVNEYPECCWVVNRATGEKHYVAPKSFTFINGTVFDNPALIELNPTYVSDLQNLPEAERARMLYGNWKIRPVGSNYWSREWCKNKKPPHDALACRAYDKAGTEPSEVYPNPDYTAGIKVLKDREGYYYIQGNFHPDFKDDNSEILGKFRKRAGARDKLILKQAIQDGTDCTVVVAKDPGSAGVTEFEDFAKRFIAEGFVVKADPMPNTKSKLTRFSPFASACENGLVFIDIESFGSKANYEDFCKEMEAFDGERSTAHRKDDRPDCCASAFNFLSKKRPFTPIKAIPINATSRKKEVLG